jgi:hypothetical protein
MRWLFPLVLVVGLGVLGCARHGTDLPDAGPLVLVERNEEAERYAFGFRIRRLFMQGCFDSLEHIADSLRTTRARFDSDYLALRAFYTYGFGDVLDDWNDVLYLRYLRWARAWRARYPQSITAPVVQAHLLVGYAWEARGGGYAYTVTREGAARMAERLAQARQVLAEAAALPRRCPGWYLVAQQVALGEGWPWEACDQLFRDAAAAEPNFEMFYQQRAWHLMPRWYGAPGDWERFLDEAVSRIDPIEARRVYARVVYKQSRYYRNVFHESEADWDRTLQGYRVLLERHPASLELRSQLCRLASQAGDYPLARRLFDEIGVRVDPFVWGDERAFRLERDRVRAAAAERAVQ